MASISRSSSPFTTSNSRHQTRLRHNDNLPIAPPFHISPHAQPATQPATSLQALELPTSLRQQAPAFQSLPYQNIKNAYKQSSVLNSQTQSFTSHPTTPAQFHHTSSCNDASSVSARHRNWFRNTAPKRRSLVSQGTCRPGSASEEAGGEY